MIQSNYPKYYFALFCYLFLSDVLKFDPDYTVKEGRFENQSRKMLESYSNDVDADSSGSELKTIFELNIDCLNELFDYLSLKELLVLSQTYKAFHQIVGEYFQWKYEAMTFDIYRSGISYHGDDYFGSNYFGKYIRRAIISGNPIEIISSHCQTLKSM